MGKYGRYFLFLIGALQTFFALAFFMQWPAVINRWPFPGTTALTFILISSLFLAAAASLLWVAATETYGGLVGIGLDYLAFMAPVSIFLFQLGGRGNAQLTRFGMAGILGALFGLGLILWGLRVPLDRSIPVPALVRWSFMVFVVVLLIAGGELVLQVPNVIPWKISPELSVIIGWMFLSALSYFAYGLLRPGWLNAAGQLVGFLAYDAVLIVPFLTRLVTTPPAFLPGLIVYTAIVLYSGVLAVYYLFLVHPRRLSLKVE